MPCGKARFQYPEAFFYRTAGDLFEVLFDLRALLFSQHFFAVVKSFGDLAPLAKNLAADPPSQPQHLPIYRQKQWETADQPGKTEAFKVKYLRCESWRIHVTLIAINNLFPFEFHIHIGRLSGRRLITSPTVALNQCIRVTVEAKLHRHGLLEFLGGHVLIRE
jgi:hypothetical protein